LRAPSDSWEYTRVKGALKNLGYTIGRSTIKRIVGMDFFTASR
jgi:hypothetical protein